MVFPLIPVIIGVGVSSWIARKAYDEFAEHDDLVGYCSNCGATCHHGFHESGLSWRKTGAMGILLGSIGLGLSATLARNIYRCRECGHLVLNCRTPGCTGMALSGDVYDDEFCGNCYKGNDKSHFTRAVWDQEKKAQMIRVLATKQRELDVLKEEVKHLKSERNADKIRLRALLELRDCYEKEIAFLQNGLAA